MLSTRRGGDGEQGELRGGFQVVVEAFLKLIIFWLCWDVVAVHGLSLFSWVAASGGYSPVVV